MLKYINNPNLKSLLKYFFMRKNNPDLPSIYKLIFIVISFFILTLIYIFLQETKLNIVSNIIALILSFFLCFLSLIASISIFIINKYEIKLGFALFINVLFMVTPMVTIRNFSVLNEIYFLILSHIFIIAMIICLYIFVEIKEEIDISDLKAMNMFLAAFLTIFAVFPTDKINNEIIKNTFEYIQQIFKFYYLIPLMMLRGLYELLYKKSKLLKKNR